MHLSPRLIDLPNLGRREFERGSAQIITEPLLLGTSSDGHNILINAPTQRNLALGHGVLLRQRAGEGVEWARLGFCRRRERAVGCCGDVVLLVEGEEVGVLQVRVEFYLVDCWDYFGCGERGF